MQKTHSEPTAPKRVIYILGLSHCGSTVLNLILAKVFGGLAVGESYAVFTAATDYTQGLGHMCSCGQRLDECPFWKPLLKDARPGPISTEEWAARYETLLQHPLAQKAEFIVDSSKKAGFLPVLTRLRERKVVEPFVVFLVRDVRGWALSAQSAWASRENSKGSWLLYHFYAWIRGNAHFQRLLENSGIPFITIGYEQFCFEPERTFEGIESASGWKRSNAQWEHHIGHGNRSKMQGGREITYDDRWMRSWKANALYSLIPWLVGKNRKWVYSEKR
ncbi:MAG TPA: hypothetical protein VMH91_00095 [Candidatus Paceibacterota bacterium]|nr:hypothetical protein [Candidatus Paceibacterota bacterium]